MFLVSFTHCLITPVCFPAEEDSLSPLPASETPPIHPPSPVPFTPVTTGMWTWFFKSSPSVFDCLLSTLNEIRIIPFSSSLFCPEHLHQSQSSSHLPHNLHLQPDHPHHACCHGAASPCSGLPPHPDSDRRWNLPSPSSHWKHLHPAHSTGRRPDAPEAQLDAPAEAEVSCCVRRAFQ